VSLSSETPKRSQLIAQLLVAMREMNGQLSLLNQTIGGCVGLASSDLEVLDLISRQGPMTPSALSAISAVSPATMTGIVDRLESEGWVRRERDPDDRRKVNIHAVTKRGAEIFRHYQGMQNRLRKICTEYTDEQLLLLVDFVTRTSEAGIRATTELRDSS
jgi:DNA-binding MarR family transcriptional regulator